MIKSDFILLFNKPVILCWRIAINNVVIVSGGQQRDSAVHIHGCILSQTLLPSRLPHNIEPSSLCYTVGFCWLSTPYTAVCTCSIQTRWAILTLGNQQQIPNVCIFTFTAHICTCNTGVHTHTYTHTQY